MSETLENYEVKAKFQDESEAELIREKLEKLVTNILAHVEKHDKRFQNTLVKSGSVYEGTKVCRPNEFDFMIRINPLTDKPSLRSCTKGDGYVKLVLDEYRWKDFKDEEGFFSPNLLSRHFKKLIIESIGSISKAEIPEGLVIQRASQDESEGRLWLLYSGILGIPNNDEKTSPSVIYSETHGPATTLSIQWQGNGSYKKLKVKVDLTPTLDYHISKLPVQLAEFPAEFQQQVQGILRKSGFHVVPAGFDVWRISFSVAEKEILATSPDGFRACYKVLKVLRDDVSQNLGWSDSLVPSHMLKTVLLSQLFTKNWQVHAWEKDFQSQTIIDVLELIFQGIVQEKIQGFFTPTYKLLSSGEHENKLRQCLVEDMLNVTKGFELAHTPEKVEEIKKQVKVLQLIDLLEYIFSCLLRGENPTAVWNMMSVAIIDNVPGHPTASKEFDISWFDIFDLNVTELCPDAYRHLKEIWSIVEDFQPCFLASLQCEENIELALKYQRFLLVKKKKFEAENPGLSKHEVQQSSLRQIITDWILVHIVDKYMANDDATLSSVHKILPSVGFRASDKSFFRDVADIAMKNGSEEGLALFKQLFKEYLSKIPELFIMSGVVGCVRHMFLNATKEALKLKLRYVAIPEKEPIPSPELEFD